MRLCTFLRARTMVRVAVHQAVFLLLLFKCGSCADSAENQFHTKLSAKEKQHYFGNTETVPSYEIVDVSHERHKRDASSIEYWFKAFNELFHLRLKRNDHLIAPGCLVHHVSANSTRLVQPCLGDGDTFRHCFYLGESLTNRTVRAALSTCNGLKGVLSTDTHTIYIHRLLQKHAGRFKRDAGLEEPHIIIRDKQDGGCQVKRDVTRIFGNVNRPFDQKVARYMELVVVADHHMFHTFRSEVQLYVHTVINAAAGTFVDKSFGAKLYLSIVKLVILEEEVEGLSVVVDATETLRGFCSWQEEIFGAGGRSERLQYDAAILITRSDLIYDGLKTTSGLAFNGGMCLQYERCVLARDRGLQVGLTVAHELGHTLGMNHDGDGNNCKAEKYMMGSNGGIGPTALLWSKCSVKAYRKFIRATGSDCLADTPHPDAWHPPKAKPGSFYNMNEQCGFYQGPSSKWCNSTEITQGDPCRRLVCYDPGNMAMCIATRAPMLDGTECGTGKWCTGGVCTEYGEDGPTAINGGWSTWPSSWSPCTRTCGGGVRIKRRYCNDPKPLYGGSQCKGVDLMSDICNIQPCETSQEEYKEEQCAETNSEPLNGVYYDWIPDKRRDIRQQCQMYCKGRKQRTVHMRRPQYKDGTSCNGNNVDYLYRCVAGKCEEFGCDGILNSGKKYDNCGICQGYDDTCFKVEGRWNTGVPHEYVEFLTIQNGSTGITITNENMFTHMALRVNGTFLINGKGGKASKDGRYEFEGVFASYDAGTPEIIKIARAVPINLEFLVWRSYGDEYHGVAPEITYEYHVQKSDVASTRYVWDLLWSKCSRSCGSGETVSISICLDTAGNQSATRAHESSCDFMEKPNQERKACNAQPCPLRWELFRQSPCSKTCGGGGTRQRHFICVLSTSSSIETMSDSSCSHLVRPPAIMECNTFECPGVWKSGNWSTCSKSCGLGNMTREVSCIRDEDTAEEVPDSECISWVKPAEVAHCFEAPCTVGKCTNKAMGCSKYGSDVCHKYKEWSDLYCSLYCGFCDEDETEEACIDLSPSTCEAFDQATCESFPEYSIVYCRHRCNMCNASLDDYANKTKEEGKDISQVNCEDGGKCAGVDEQVCSANKTWAIKECPLTCDLCWENAVLQMMEAEDCQDKVNCHEYAPSMCTEYQTWAKKNCKRHCGFCKNQVALVTTTTTPCHDIVDCSEYQENVCVEFEAWASKNCRMSCGFCEPDVAITTQAPCTDKVDCPVYGEDVCTEYIAWSKKNCEKHCKMCDKEETISVQPTTPTTVKPCSDKVDCTLYEVTVCDDYRAWAQENCGHFCGFCKSVSGCFDTVDCTSYDANVCADYADWAAKNCRKSCGLCSDVTTPAPQDTQDECKDSLVTCSKYSKRDCDDYPHWAQDNCRRHCGLCETVSAVAPTSASCKDVKICSAYNESVCTDYEEWSQLNCRKFCGFCIEPTRKKEECEDLDDCPRYNIDICKSETYAVWAAHNCKRYCKICKVDIEQPQCDDIYFESRGNFSISAGQCNKTISVNITELIVLQLPPIYVDCDAGEFLQLRDTKGSRQFCGNITDRPIQIQAHEVDIEMMFESRPEPAIVEWSARTNGKHEDSGCRSKSMDALQGHVTSPRYPNRYQQNANCTTFITVVPGKKVALTFWHFDVELHSRCKCDYLIIKDLRSQRTTDKLCGQKEKFTWVSDSSHILIQFISDASDNWLGYSASYAAVD